MHRSGCALLVMALLGTASPPLAHEGGPSRFNFHDHIRPLLEKRCGGCHRDGGAAPMTLLEYDEVVPWSRTMMLQILEGSMPPWLPADGIGDFHDVRRLSATEIDMLIDWSVGELPEGEEEFGDAATPPPEWSSGKPDLVLRPDSAISIEVDEEEKLQCLTLPIDLPEPRLATAFEVKPGLPTMVQRATLYRSTSCGPPGRPLFTWLPDQKRITVPGGLGELLPAGSSLSMEILYRRGWDDESIPLQDRTELGIWFTSTTEPIQSVRVTSSKHSFPTAVELLAIYPDPTSVDDPEPLRVEAQTPEGRVVPLLVIKRYEPLWREKYLIRGPLLLPEGSEIRLSRPSVWIEFAPARSHAQRSASRARVSVSTTSGRSK